MNSLNVQKDEDLIKAYLNGNTKAFEIVLMRYKDRIYGNIFNIVKDHAVADDLFQELFIKAILKLKAGKYQETGKFAAWLSRLAFNLSMDYFRSHTYQTVHIEDENLVDYLNENDVLIDDHLEGAHYEESLFKAEDIMSKLPEEQRKVVYMRYYQNLSYKEIAQTLDCSINTALGRMRYAIKNMQKIARAEQCLDELYL